MRIPEQRDRESWRGSGFSLPERLIMDRKKLKRTNLMRRRESQALLEGVRKLRHQVRRQRGCECAMGKNSYKVTKK